MFFRKSQLEPLPLTMAGVRMGERLLQIGLDDPGLAGALAAKVGLSGAAAHAVTNDRDAARAQSAAAAAGVLVDVQQVASLRRLSFPADSFDLVVVHARNGMLGAMAPEERVGSLQQVHRVLRQGGRVIVIEAAPREGVAGLFRRPTVDVHYAQAGGAEGALRAEGFRAVRVLGEREGYKFTEGLKG